MTFKTKRFIIIGKRSQYFVVASIIFISLALSLVSVNLMGGKSRQVFDELKNNFLTEAYIAVNSASSSYQYGSESVPEFFDNYVSDFIIYSASRNIDFKLVYLLLYDNRIYIKSNMDVPYTISTRYDTVILEPNMMINISAYNYVELYSSGKQYLFIFDESPLQLRSLFELRVSD